MIKKFILLFALILFLTSGKALLRAQKGKVGVLIEQTTESSQTEDTKPDSHNIPGETMGQKLESLLFWSQEEREQRFPLMHHIFPSQPVASGPNSHDLQNGENIMPLWEDKTTLQDYMATNHIGGIMVLKDNQIRLEAYGDNVDQETLWTSFSMAKSVSSMLLGVALKEGAIASLDDPLQKYIPELKDRDYGTVTIRQLLTMTSGIAWNEDYEDPHSDVAQMYLKPCQDNEPHILSYMKPLKFSHQPGEYWNYSTGETDLLGILIQKATGKSLASYLSEKIWQPWGMEQKAYWLVDECSGLNIGGSGLSASLRDYARLGALMLHEGQRKPKSLFADEWIENATALLHQTGGNDGGYGYLWWRNPNGSYAAIGIFGQMIYIDPSEQIVIVQLAAWPKASSKALTAGRQAFITAVEKALR